MPDRSLHVSYSRVRPWAGRPCRAGRRGAASAGVSAGPALYGGERLTRVWGTAFSFGESPEFSAHEFVQTYSGVFGVTADDLPARQRVQRPLHAAADVRPARLARYKFTLVYYRQYRDGIPVYNADLRLLVAQRAGLPARAGDLHPARPGRSGGRGAAPSQTSPKGRPAPRPRPLSRACRDFSDVRAGDLGRPG